ncbi:CHAT domain-containing protein [Geitlerinema sp. PCC 9228]|uniref:CHAT domain-containing protein n=1 Tax=Geitlerinema sp. PCC 9228 TaxID=111611 RepID=UPI0008F993DA|nr:CHAT domain-containing protein [Geitlerinema sp. PCC 9228]
MVATTITVQHPQLQKAGYTGELASYEVGLQYCQRQTHPKGWGRLHYHMARAHFIYGKKQTYAGSYFHKAVSEYEQALETLTFDAYPEYHLEVVRDFMKALLGLRQRQQAKQWQQHGVACLQELVNQRYRSQGKYGVAQLQLKFMNFKLWSVDFWLQEGNWGQAWQSAELNKNQNLTWLLHPGTHDLTRSYSEIVPNLGEDTALVAWHDSGNLLATFILQPGATIPQVLGQELSGDALWDSLQQQHQQFQTWLQEWNRDYQDYGKKAGKTGNSNHSWRQNMASRLQQLYQILRIDDIVAQLQVSRLLLVPHRDLHRLPLHDLFPETFTIAYLPSAEFYHQRSPETTTATHSLLSIEHPNNDLETAQVESHLITQLFSQTTRLASHTATANNIQTALPQSHNCLHFTGHAQHNLHHPQKSSLALAGADQLTVADLQNFDLSHYFLVSLSACETGITGSLDIETEYVGLASAFLDRGVSRVVSTLWYVPSEASSWIAVWFYRYLQKGQLPATALQKATHKIRYLTQAHQERYYRWLQKRISKSDGLKPFLDSQLHHLEQLDTSQKRQHRPFQHPYYWAAFTISGGF